MHVEPEKGETMPKFKIGDKVEAAENAMPFTPQHSTIILDRKVGEIVYEPETVELLRETRLPNGTTHRHTWEEWSYGVAFDKVEGVVGLLESDLTSA